MKPPQILPWQLAVSLLLVVALPTASAGAIRRGVPVVGRLLSTVPDNPPACVGDERIVFRYEVLYAHQSSGDLPDNIDVLCSCQLVQRSQRAARPNSRPVFATGELHELRVRVDESAGQEKHLTAVTLEQRRKPIATQISDLKGYERHYAALVLEHKMQDFPCANTGSEVKLPIRLQTDTTGCVSSVTIESKPIDPLVRCTQRKMRQWDFGYPGEEEDQGRRRGALSFVAIFPR